MRIIGMSEIAADQRAGRSWPGPSKPWTNADKADVRDLMRVSWWTENEKFEAFGERHAVGLRLYLEIAQSAEIDLASNEFPAQFVFRGRYSRAADRAVIKTCLEHVPPILSHRMVGHHLIWCVTDAGQREMAMFPSAAQASAE